jgi:hypothetical protein
MPPGLEFGVNKLPVHTDLKAAAIGWNESEAFDLRFKILEQLVSQAHGPAGIVSNRTIDDLDLHHYGIFGLLSENYTASCRKLQAGFDLQTRNSEFVSRDS